MTALAGCSASATRPKPLSVWRAQDVLHVHGVAGAEERAVEDRCARAIGRVPALRRQLEAPRLDAVAATTVCTKLRSSVGLRRRQQAVVEIGERLGGVVVAVVEVVEVLEAVGVGRSAARGRRRAGR